MAKPEVKVLESYSGTFTDPAAGKEYTLALVNQGSDINFAVAGATSAGVIDAAKSSNTFAIGVDSDQNYMAPGHVLTSMVKRVDTQAFDMIKSVVDGTFKGGTVLYYGLKEGGVDAAMDEYNKGLIPDDVLKQVDELRQKVISGEIVVPNYFDLKPGAEGDGHAADGDAAFGRQRQVAARSGRRTRPPASPHRERARGRWRATSSA